MLWSCVRLFLLVGAVLASSHHGFKDGKEYIFKVRSRTLAALDRESKQHAGVLMKAHLVVQSINKEALRAKILQPQYSQIHAHLENGWESVIPEDYQNLQELPLSDKPFEIKIKNGVIQDLVVDKEVSTWEVNLLKAIISQIQVDLKGENAVKSENNQLPKGDLPSAGFTVMEDSVGGKCEVFYVITPRSFLNPDSFSVTKTKNYNKCEQRVSYHFGINGRNNWEPGSNDNGKYLSRNSVSYLDISGDLKDYTIKSSVTINKVILSPDQAEHQGMVNSKMNLTLSEIKEASEQLKAPTNSQSVGNLVYNYNNPSGIPSSRRNNKLIHKSKNNSEESSESESTENENEDNYFQPKPKLTDSPLNPMLSYFIGHKGNSIKNKVDIVRSAKSIAHEIGNDMKKSDGMLEENTLEKFIILTRLVRTMSAEQIDEVQRDLYKSQLTSNNVQQDIQSQNTERNAWVAFRDAVAQAGTGPALVNIKKWIQVKQIEGFEAESVIDAMAKSVRTPTPEYIDTFFDLIKMEETKKQAETAILSFADLVRHAIVNKQSAHNRYPVHAFGKFFGRKTRAQEDKYFSYLVEELKAAIESGDSKRIQIHIVAIGRTASAKIPSVFEPYFEGTKQATEYQRLLMVISLDQLASIHQKIAQKVLHKIYMNTANSYEIRTAAVYLLMRTNPPASMLQSMAEFTNTDSSKHVNSAVKSVLSSLAKENLINGRSENVDLPQAAFSALPFLTREKFGLQYSKASFLNFKHPLTHTGLSLAAYYLGSDDTILPRGVALSVNPNLQGLKIPKIQYTNVVSSTREFLEELVMGEKNSNSNEKDKQKKYSPENISKLLGIKDFGAKQLEGFFVFNENTRNIFMAFDNQTLKQIPEKIRQLNEEMKKGIKFNEAKFSNYEVTMSFPTETGFPLTFSLKVPSIINMKGDAKVSKFVYDKEKRSPIPQAESVSAVMKLAVGVKLQKRLSFVTPFDIKEYITGIDKDLQVYLPIRGEANYDIAKMETSLKVQPAEDEPEYKVLQYKKQPYTSKHDILSLRPVLSDKNTHVIHKNHATPSQIELNHWSNKPTVQFTWASQSKYQSDLLRMSQTRQNAAQAAYKMAREIFSLVYPNEPQKAEEYEAYSVKVTPQSNWSAEINVSYGFKEAENDKDYANSPLDAKAPSMDENLSSGERKNILLQEVVQKINGQGHALDVDFRLNTGALSYVTFTAALANSNIDRRLKMLGYGSIKCMEDEDYHVSVGLESQVPEIKTMDFEETLKGNATAEIDAEVQYGKGHKKNSDDNKIKISVKTEHTEKRRDFIRDSQEAQLCKQQMLLTGNKLTEVCQKVNDFAEVPDAIEFDITLDKHLPVQEISETLTESFERSAWMMGQSGLEWDYNEKTKKNEIKIGVEFPTEDKADVSITTHEGKAVLKNLDIPEVDRASNIQNDPSHKLLKEKSCSLDKTQVKTFDDKIYPSQIGNCWHVAMTTFPKQDADHLNRYKDIPDDMRVSILTRENNDGKKEVKLTMGDKEFNLKPSETNHAEIEVDGQKIKLSNKRGQQVKSNDVVVVEIILLSDESIKLTSDVYDFRVTYDGTRAQIEVGEGYRQSVRGLCGNYDGEPDNDQQSPKGCLLQKSEEFMSTYALTTDDQCAGPALQNFEKAKESGCTNEIGKI